MIKIQQIGVQVKKQTKKRSSKELRDFFSSPRKAGSSALNIGKLLEHYAYAEAIVATISEPMIILDKSLRVKSANDAFFKLFKHNKKEVYGKKIFDFSLKKSEIPNLKKILKDVLDNNIPLQELELTHTFERAGEKTLLLSARRIVLEGYKTKLILVSIEDISKRKSIERQKDDFVGYVTHELKTPLTSLSMLTQMLTGYHKKTQDKKSLYFLDKVMTQIERLTNLLNAFSNVYKAQNGILDLKKEKIDINKLTSDVVAMFQYTENTHDIQHTGTIKKQISVDKERIHEVLVNLLTNAIKYSPNADKVIVNLSEDEKKVIISVQDFGLGIPREETNKVFERFFRVKAKEENRIKGLGLGLYIVNEIVRAHKGKLWVESTEGVGSTFYVSLPKK